MKKTLFIIVSVLFSSLAISNPGQAPQKYEWVYFDEDAATDSKIYVYIEPKKTKKGLYKTWVKMQFGPDNKDKFDKIITLNYVDCKKVESTLGQYDLYKQDGTHKSFSGKFIGGGESYPMKKDEEIYLSTCK